MKLKLMEGKALTKLIAMIGTARVQLDMQVQEGCLQVIGQSVVHRNITPGNMLVEAVSKHHRAVLVTYLEKFGNFEWDRKAEKFGFREVHAKEKLEDVLDMIGDAKWYDAKKPPKVISQYDAVKVLADQFDKLFKAKAKGTPIQNLTVLEAVHAAYCRAVAEQYESGDESLAKLAVDQALEARNKGLASPQQLQLLAEHFGRQVPQIEVPAKQIAEHAAAEGKALAEFGAEPKAVAQQ